MNALLQKAICPHRGLGEENSLEAIVAAIQTKPFFVEFDIQSLNNTFYLGHPPKINKEATLEDALALYETTDVMPKIDLKCLPNWKADIDLLSKHLKGVDFKVLINVGGDNLAPKDFMDAEKYLMQNAPLNILLNIDIARYGSLSLHQIERHINSLEQKPYSVSPDLEDNYDIQISLSAKCGVTNIHFWSSSSVTYAESKLLDIYERYLTNNNKVLFDIKPEIVVAT